MERNKQAPGTRGPKSKITQQPPDLFIALGAKPAASREADAKRNVPILPKTSSGSPISSSSSKVVTAPLDRKREQSSASLSGVPPVKKMKVLGRTTSIPGPSMTSIIPMQPPGGVEPWEALAQDQEPTELFNTILENVTVGNTDKAVPYILGAIRTLRAQRFKPCKVTYNTLLLACQVKPLLFTNEHVVNALISSLRRDFSSKSPNKSLYNQIIFINLLLNSYIDISNWPEFFLKLYVEDAVCDRSWIDNPYFKPFVDNIVTAFNTKQPPRALLCTETWTPTSRDTGSPLTINTNDEDEVMNEHRVLVEKWSLRTYPRYTQMPEAVEQIVLEAIKEQLSRRQQPETISKNFVRFLSMACGLVEIRIIAASRIETWLHNHKLMKPAQELLAYLCYNCSASTQRDLEVVLQLSKLRLKNKQMVNFFNNCLREMVISFPENLCPLLKYTIYNELSNARNTNNLFVVGAMFQVAPEASADAFADICLELLMNKDDYLRSLRALLKEINRVLRHDFNLLSVVHSLLRERKEMTASLRDSEIKDRIFLSLADLVCMCMLLCVNPQVRDAATQSKRDVTVLQGFQSQVSNIQREAVTWLHDSASRIFRPTTMDFQHVLLKVVFLEQAEHYYKVDSWPGENERNVFLRLASEVPLLQATLLRILLIGLAKETPLAPTDVIEIADQLIRRASNLPSDCLPPLAMDKIEIIDFFFNLCSYNYPENIGLPPGYVAPKLAIVTLYWKSWLMLLILAAHNPSSFGSLAWNKYPTLRMFMEMCITNHFSYPPPTMIMGEGADEFNLKEQQTLALEKQTILEFESHLAAASTKIEINEQTSLLLPQLIELKPLSDARRPPQQVLDQLQSLNNTHRMGHLLCRSRHPDFLLDIMSRHGGTAHMPWLAELVNSSEGALAHLPVQCLCEYLLSTCPTEKLTKHLQLLAHLRKVVSGNDAQMACEVLEYLLRRLTSLHASNRQSAIKGLTLVLSPNEETDLNVASVDNTYWLTQYILSFPHLHVIRSVLIQFLRQAILLETNPTHVSNYITFLSTHGLDDPLSELLELIFDLASLIVERNSIMSYILPGENTSALRCLISVFWVYLQKAKEPTDDAFPWSECQDQVVVTWASGEQCTLQILIVHASIILLTYGPVESYEPFDGLLDLWFPVDEEQPKAYLVDTSEEALLVPDWLKLRMIRSNVPRLLDAAVEKLEAPQLVLFIQSFGIPVVSISKLLQVLDRVTITDPKLVVDSVLDKNYMIQLVDVQNRRGAIGGDIFVKALEMQIPPINDDNLNIDLENRKQLPGIGRRFDGAKDVKENELYQTLERVFSQCPATMSKDVNYLCKVITTDSRISNCILDFLQTVSSDAFVRFADRQNHPAMLFRLLFSKKQKNGSAVDLATAFLTLLPEKHVVSSILKQFLKDGKEPTVKMDVDETESPAAVDPGTVIRNVGLVTSRKSERILDNPENLGQKLGRLLMENRDPEKTGLLVDWLAAVELEMANTGENKVQMELLFSKKQLPFRPLLISTMLQRASWKTLNTVIDYLLIEGHVEKHCASSVLDCLTALTQSPRLWQGRDKAIPKHHQPEDVLQFDSEKLLVLISYILEESNCVDDWERIMEKRLPLVLHSIAGSSETIVKKLIETSTGNVKSQELLLLLYMNLPSIGKFLNTKQYSNFSFSKMSYSTIDVISHTILSALTAITKMKDWNRRSKELELCARKLAATHPDLVLRQLPMLAGCLRGRFQYDWNVFRSRGHFLLFGQVLGLLELLQPRIFQYTASLSGILDSYMDLFRFHGHMKDLTSIVTRLVTFLQNWMVKDLRSCLKYLQQYGHILNDIELSQPSVRPLLSSVSLPVQDQSSPTEQLLIGAPTVPVPLPLPQNWQSLVVAIQSPDPLSSLQEVEHLTTKRPQLLHDISAYLFNCITSRNGQVRTVSMNLIIRYLKNDPKESSRALPAIVTCLDSKEPDVVKTVLDRLSEIVVVMQEYATVILTRVYQLGINSNLNACSNISKCIATLSLQSGC